MGNHNADSPAPYGVLNLDKPAGWTSHDVVARVRRLTDVRRVGHSGTLDPMATGVLVLCLGRATRLLEYLISRPKRYLAEITLGVATDTYDATGQPGPSRPAPTLSRDELEAALSDFRGDIMQAPPPYSALKRDGQPLYKRARRGEIVVTTPRPVTIYELKLLALAGDLLQVEVACSAGVYVRSLAHDLGQKLGCGAHLSGLQRLAVGHFTIAEAISLIQLEQAAAASQWLPLLLPPDTAVAHLGRLTLAEEDVGRLLHGQAIDSQPRPPTPEGPNVGADTPVRAYGPSGQLLAIVRFDPERQAWRPLKVLAQAN